jgi:hypothetical protein
MERLRSGGAALRNCYADLRVVVLAGLLKISKLARQKWIQR